MSKLTFEERIKIKALKEAGLNASKISSQLNRSKSTITRELSRNSVDGIYDPYKATELSKSRRQNTGKKKITDDNWTYVRSLLQMNWSPEQISGWLKNNPTIGFYVSDQWIYEYIKQNQQVGGDLYKSLRREGKPYRNKKAYRGTIKNRVCIDHRPDIVNKRLRIGDWEVDSVIGKLHQSSLVTLVERVSKYTVIMKVNSKEAAIVSQAIINKAKELKLPIRTITGDNGTEFADHEEIANELDIDFYFTYPYSSWEKGTNENTNGLIRQYFPKGTDFNTVSTDTIAYVERQLNNRPRKTLDYKKPIDVIKQIKR